jgi:hypothetical protein
VSGQIKRGFSPVSPWPLRLCLGRLDERAGDCCELSAQDNSLIMLRKIDGTQFVWLAKNETGA